MDSKVTALERAFQLARSGHMATVGDIRKRLRREGYDDRAVADGGRLLLMQLRRLMGAAGAGAVAKREDVGPPPLIKDDAGESRVDIARVLWIAFRNDFD